MNSTWTARAALVWLALVVSFAALAADGAARNRRHVLAAARQGRRRAEEGGRRRQLPRRGGDGGEERQARLPRGRRHADALHAHERGHGVPHLLDDEAARLRRRDDAG